jgi:L-alanine-DL-glutamate epimerase-like enolase superfamily enzyme
MGEIPNAGKYLEFSIEGAEYYPWQQDLFTYFPSTIEGGRDVVTDEPGWGGEIQPQWLAKSRYQINSAS